MLEPLRDMSCSQHGTSACSRTATAGSRLVRKPYQGSKGDPAGEGDDAGAPAGGVDQLRLDAGAPAGGGDQLRLDAGGRLQLLDARRDGRRAHAAVKHLLRVLRQRRQVRAQPCYCRSAEEV